MLQDPIKPRLSGRRIAIVEDEFLIARDISEALAKEGAEIVGPFSSVKRALTGLESDLPSAVLLDLNLGGQRSLPIAENLTHRNIPFLVVTGYGSSTITEDLLRRAPTVAKPFDDEALISGLLNLLEDPACS
ncbi:MAG: response regulator [bacterium]